MSDETQKTIEEIKLTLQEDTSELIEEYLKICGSEAHSPENIADWFYIFLGSERYKENLHNYPYAAGKALSAFASRQEVRDGLWKFMGEDQYLTLCEMLHNMIEFCNIIHKLEPNRVRLEKEAYEDGWIAEQMSVEELRIEKEMYALKLRRIKAKTAK